MLIHLEQNYNHSLLELFLLYYQLVFRIQINQATVKNYVIVLILNLYTSRTLNTK